MCTNALFGLISATAARLGQMVFVARPSPIWRLVPRQPCQTTRDGGLRLIGSAHSLDQIQVSTASQTDAASLTRTASASTEQTQTQSRWQSTALAHCSVSSPRIIGVQQETAQSFRTRHSSPLDTTFIARTYAGWKVLLQLGRINFQTSIFGNIGRILRWQR
jgi:hypothetical protein